MLLKCFGMRLFFLTIPKPLKQYTLFKKRLSITLSKAYADNHVLRVFTGCALPCNDTVGVASSFH